MYEEVLPRFMAYSALEAIKERKPFILRFSGIEQRMVEAAKEHIKWARDMWPERVTVGILYVLKERRFYTFQVAEPFIKFFKGVRSYRSGKTEVLERMILTGKKAEKVVHELMKN